MNDQSAHPEGELLLRTSPMPSDTNGNGDIFGGWIMSQMDIAGGMMAMERTGGRAVTVAVDTMKFIKPVNVGDIVCCYGTVLRTGTTSVTIRLEVWVKPSVWRTAAAKAEAFFKVTEASFTYVAIDHEGHKRPVPKKATPENNADEK
ncbi:MAG: acyl-CoA thioester hydrolase YciA [Desulfuromonadaceae bacterium]|nr:acyl-CoA thioester hydrolase YciA [Desulfuromonadaceae bacterium]MDD2848082.1 acyl-CoA thioester hydrolase YciA [Desulfuromonadaceae bacterium]MDD4132077.1 acyl-CoA thioester hydrolase YciA [Desulfuromonadaceae bacterium]